MKSLYENKLAEAMHLYAENTAAEFPTEDEAAKVAFSTEFEQKMERIIIQRKRPFFRIFNTAIKKTVSVAAIFIVVFTLSLSVKAIREPFLKMFKKIFDNHVEIELKGTTKDCIDEIYAVTEIPDGYVMTDEMINTSMVYREYKKDDGTSFSYTQSSTTGHMGLSIDNEHSRHYNKKIDDTELYIADFEEYNIKLVYWLQDGYLFDLDFYNSRPSDDDIIAIIKSNTLIGYQETE